MKEPDLDCDGGLMDLANSVAGIHYPDLDSFNQIIERMKTATGTDSDRALSTALGLKAAAVSAARRRQQVPASWIVETVIRFKASDHKLIFGAQNKGQTSSEFCLLPVLSAVDLAQDGKAKSTEEKEFRVYKRDWLESLGQPERFRVLRVRGKSMEPLIHDKDLVLIDTGLVKLQTDSDIFAVFYNNVAVIKRICLEPGKLILSVENKALSPDIAVSDEETGLVKILGRVIWWEHEVN